jgi:DNA-directed RNA polymerase subunit M/transcription elongation factor TFIIS
MEAKMDENNTADDKKAKRSGPRTCPKCKSKRVVIYSMRHIQQMTARYFRCSQCAARFSTSEVKGLLDETQD